MLSRFRSGLTYANVMATVAVFLSLGGGADAALKLPKNSVGSQQLKKNAVRSSKVKNRSLLAKDFKKGQVPKGPTGPRGVAGSPGTSVFSASIPSGRTVTGSWGAAGDPGDPASGGFLEVGVSLPVKAPAPLEDVNMGVGQPNASSPDPGCTGSAYQPTAPRGKVCVYVLPYVQNVTPTGIQATPMDGGATAQSDRYGFLIAMAPTATAKFVEAYGTWAYTAP